MSGFKVTGSEETPVAVTELSPMRKGSAQWRLVWVEESHSPLDRSWDAEYQQGLSQVGFRDDLHEREGPVWSGISETVAGSRTLVVGGNLSERVGGNRTLKLDKDLVLNVAGTCAHTTQQGYTLKSSGEIVLSAGERFVLEAGSAVLEMKKGGEVVLQGAKVEVKAAGAVVLEGSSISEN